MAYFTIAVVFWAWSSAAMACMCLGGKGKAAEFVDSVDILFLGYVQSQSEPYEGDLLLKSDFGAISRYVSKPNVLKHNTKFHVIKAYKGLETVTVDVESGSDEASCGKIFAADEIHFVRAVMNDDGVYSTTMCMDQFLLDNQVIKFLERGEDFNYPNRELCYVSIKQAYDAEVFTGKFDMEPLCEIHKPRYDRIFRVKQRTRRPPLK